MPKLKLGAVVYALVAILLVVELVRMLRRDGSWAGVHGWAYIAMVLGIALSCLLLVIGAVTRRGLIADDGPWICQYGWLVLVAMTAAGWVVVFVSEQEIFMWPTGPAVFVPHLVRKYQESYYDGISEGERELEIRAAVRGEESPPAP